MNYIGFKRPPPSPPSGNPPATKQKMHEIREKIEIRVVGDKTRNRMTFHVWSDMRVEDFKQMVLKKLPGMYALYHYTGGNLEDGDTLKMEYKNGTIQARESIFKNISFNDGMYCNHVIL
jgi:hypothetical protein